MRGELGSPRKGWDAIGDALAEAWAQGYVVTLESDRLRVLARDSGAAVGLQAAHPGAWFGVLRTSAEMVRRLLRDRPEPDSWLDPTGREWWSERAAILEYDGGLPRELAESVAVCWFSSALGTSELRVVIPLGILMLVRNR